MARLLRSLRAWSLGSPAQPAASPTGTRFRCIDTDFTVFREGDRAVINAKQQSLTKPLKHGRKTNLRRGYLEHDRIIGSRVWDTIQAHKGPDTRLSFPTLEEYVTLTPRHVTPIYPHDANLIVSLLDIHVNPPLPGEKRQPLEILESGTGHGSLTLHLARAMQAANTVPPPHPPQSQIQYVANRNLNPRETETPDTNEQVIDADQDSQREWDAWRAERGAVIHTVDVSSKFAKLAEQNVQGFRRGIYGGTVDHYVGAVEEWVDEQVARRAKTQRPVEPFLSCAILDMPSAHERIPLIKDIIKRDGRLVVFAPSITQIGDCVKAIHGLGRSFVMERVVELGAGLTSGRYWDVRLAMKKSAADPSTWEAAGESGEATQASSPEEQSEAEDAVDEVPKTSDSSSRAIDEQNAVMVCRPKVGLRTFGGGFVGVWRRIEDS